MVKIKCKYCGKEEKHYAKGLCRNCYNRMNHNGFTTIEELSAFDKGKHERVENKKAIISKREANTKDYQVRSCNEFDLAPRGRVTKRVFKWYYDETSKYLVFEFETKKQRLSAYNSIYAMTKRRHDLHICRFVRGNKMILERVDANEV